MDLRALKTDLRALQIAVEAGFFVVHRKEAPKYLTARGDVLEFGPRADKHLIVTLACRRKLAKATGGKAPSERAVQRLVERLGYRYRPRTLPSWLVERLLRP